MAITEVVLNTLAAISAKRGVPVYPGIRTDQAAVNAARARKFLADFDPRSKALEDYQSLTDRLLQQFAPGEVVRIDEKTA